MATEQTLEELALRAAKGDRDAFREIYERTADKLFTEVLAAMLPTRAAREDVLREAFLVALEKLPSLAAGEVFPWLATIARNRALDRLRRMGTESRFQALVADDLRQRQSEQPLPDAQAAAAEARGQLRAQVDVILQELNPRYAQALRLRLLEDRTRQQCAEAFEVSLGTFDVLFFRACKQFRALYVERYGAKVEAS